MRRATFPAGRFNPLLEIQPPFLLFWMKLQSAELDSNILVECGSLCRSNSGKEVFKTQICDIHRWDTALSGPTQFVVESHGDFLDQSNEHIFNS